MSDDIEDTTEDTSVLRARVMRETDPEVLLRAELKGMLGVTDDGGTAGVPAASAGGLDAAVHAERLADVLRRKVWQHATPGSIAHAQQVLEAELRNVIFQVARAMVPTAKAMFGDDETASDLPVGGVDLTEAESAVTDELFDSAWEAFWAVRNPSSNRHERGKVSLRAALENFADHLAVRHAAEVERLAGHSTTLNTVSWRIAAVLGYPPDDAGQIDASPVTLANQVVSEMVSLRAELDVVKQTGKERETRHAAEAEAWRKHVDAVNAALINAGHPPTGSFLDAPATPTPAASPRLDRLAEIRELRPGWLDGQGLVPDPDTLAAVEALIEEYGLDGVRIYPTEVGGLTLEWEVGATAHELVIQGSGDGSATPTPAVGEAGGTYWDGYEHALAHLIAYRSGMGWKPAESAEAQADADSVIDVLDDAIRVLSRILRDRWSDPGTPAQQLQDLLGEGSPFTAMLAGGEAAGGDELVERIANAIAKVDGHSLDMIMPHHRGKYYRAARAVLRVVAPPTEHPGPKQLITGAPGYRRDPHATGLVREDPDDVPAPAPPAEKPARGVDLEAHDIGWYDDDRPFPPTAYRAEPPDWISILPSQGRLFWWWICDRHEGDDATGFGRTRDEAETRAQAARHLAEHPAPPAPTSGEGDLPTWITVTGGAWACHHPDRLETCGGRDGGTDGAVAGGYAHMGEHLRAQREGESCG